MKKFNSKKNKFSKGVALLFAIVVSMILFTILAGVLNISLNETLFSISVKSSNDAFYVADSAVECALLNDKSDTTNFTYNSTGGNISCFGNNISVIKSASGFNQVFDFNVVSTDSDACARVNIKKDYDASTDPADPTLVGTTITSRGYNKGGSSDCDQSGLKSVERVLEVNY